ncbi:type II secretion system F family protein [Candidatus Aalborgicola defluviihabitans]|uniref:type II secretion system F family protein n=2 Tax=Candidatus Aalborgicola defluviihabitans TaxID=3386187 RepID=UPI001DECE13C|nr:type II secretion system F family protein [Burkholderiales bacterium]MBK6570790.1 type II secretion system F family protein [Burkholderiales bacterium]MBK7279785.1 type II secretion system F family protein [Burkholderiales bacterium]MBK7312529.1 type II secretion system F family protein [Burkholderiales bacterium]MBL0243338.1 type II secretion system F family protein [Rhodoferax sp.]
MPRYRYKAVTPSGDAQEGDMDGASQPAVVERLQGMGLIPIRVDESVTKVGNVGGVRGFFNRNHVSQDDVAVFTQEIATLLKAGLPLDRCLEILIGLSANEAVRELMVQLREDVRGGAPLSAAMEARQGVFTRFYLNMIRAGEAGGALDVVLQRLTEFMERSKELRDTVKSALIYPAILVGVSLLSVAILLMWVVPQFSQMFEESGKALPLPTQIVIAAGDGVRNYWWLMVLLAVGAYSWFARQMREPASRFRWDQRLLNLPLVGDLIGKLEVARFSRTLGTLIGNGVTLLAALSIVKETLSNTVMCQALGDVAAQLKEGKGLGKPLMETKLFPKLAVHLVMVGEETGKLQDMLIRIADIYDREVHSTVKRMLALMEPVLILGLGLVIGGIIMSILVAILSVNDLAL